MAKGVKGFSQPPGHTMETAVAIGWEVGLFGNYEDIHIDICN